MWATPRRLSWRRFRSLVAGLPPTDSALGRALAIRQVGEWGLTEDLLAFLIEVVDLGNRSFVSAHSKKGASKPRPITIPRPPAPRRKGEAPPVDEPGKKRMATSEELVAFFGGTARYTGPKRPLDRARCALGHYVRAGKPCRRCMGV